MRKFNIQQRGMTKIKKTVVVFALFPLCSLLSQTNSNQPFPINKIGPNLYKIEVDVNSIIASIGPDGVLLCDIGGKSKGPRIMATVRELGGKRIDIIINTHWHVDHTGGNIFFGKEAIIIAHKNVRKRLAEAKYLKFWDEKHPAFPEYALPDLVFSDQLTLHFNGEDVELIHLPGGHTDSDAIVYFRNANILHAGDCLFSNGFPAIDFEMGGSIEGFADNLKRIASMMPSDVRIVTGHGPDYTIEELLAYEKMVRSSLHAVRDAMQKGLSVEAMQEAHLLNEWKEYGGGLFSCDEWIKMIYQSLIYQTNLDLKASKQESVLKGLYLGQKPPGKTPELFAPGIVCTEKNEGYLVFLDHGRVLVFDRWLPQVEESNPYVVMHMKDGIWTKPRPCTHKQSPYNPALPIKPDEKTLFFALNRSMDGAGESETGWDIWMTNWTGQGFSHIRRLETPVSSEKRDAWASLAQNGNLYFMSNRDEGYGRWDIYKAVYENGRYMDVRNIGYPVNSEESEADPAIAPDESYLLFCSHRPGGFGESDLFITFRKKDGSWTVPQNMGPAINTSADEEKPYITPDGKYLFFSNDAPGNLEIYWVDARIIEDLKPEELKRKAIPFRADQLSERVLFIKSGDSAIISNATAIATSQGLVVIDAHYKPEGGRRIRRIVKKAFERDDFTYLIYTHAGVDHMGGASAFPEALVVGHKNCTKRIAGLRNRLQSVDIRKILNPRLELLRTKMNSGPVNDAERIKLDEALYYWSELCEMLVSGFEYRQPNLTFDEKLVLHLGDITIKLHYCTPDYSESDILIHVPEEKLLVVGDIFNRDRIPLLHEKSDVKRWLDLFEPFIIGKEEVRHIIGGHDEMISLDELKAQYEYLKDLWEGVSAAKKQGLTLDKIKNIYAFNKRYSHLSHLKIYWISTPDNLHERNIEYIWKIAKP